MNRTRAARRADNALVLEEVTNPQESRGPRRSAGTGRITRRQFVRTTSAAVAAGLGGLRPSGAQEEGPQADPTALPIVDTHQHLWDLDKFRLPWLKPGMPLYRSFLSADYRKAVEGLPVVQAVYMEVAVAPEQKLAEAEYVVERCRQKDNLTVAAVIGGMPASEGFQEYITRFRNSPYVKGVRQIPPATGQGEYLYDQKEFIAGIRLLGRLGMRFDLCMPPQRLPEAVRLVDACPETRFICDHCGNADPKAFWDAARREAVGEAAPPAHDAGPWRRGMAELAKRDNVVCKISGIIARAPKDRWVPEDLAPIIHHCLDVFGPDRVMFASDWPVCTRVASLRQWAEALRQVVRDRSDQERRKLFGQNAVRFYGLPRNPVRQRAGARVPQVFGFLQRE